MHVNFSYLSYNPKSPVMTQLTAMDQLYPPRCRFRFFPSSESLELTLSLSPHPLSHSLLFIFSLGPLSFQPPTSSRCPWQNAVANLARHGWLSLLFRPNALRWQSLFTHRPGGANSPLRLPRPPSLARSLTGSLATVKRRSPSRLYLICVMDRSWPCSRIGFCGDRTGVSVPGTPSHAD